MAPNKFEEHVKKQLAEREIQPSAEAWKKISEQLGVSEKPKRKYYLWYGAAASFIGAVLVSTFYFNAEHQEMEPKTPMVGAPQKTIEEREHIITTDQPIDPVKLVEVEKNRSDKTANKVIEPKRIVATKHVSEKTKELSEKTSSIKIPNTASEELLNTKILEIVAQVDLLERDNDALTDAEVDSLLRRAQQEILNEKLYLDNPRVDAMALLSDVEEELDQSFRDRIFESLKTGFVKVRTAVADRNR
ncbi:MAG: hypothetical protein ACFCUL_12880 [Flavobacteriaceae bacterium]